MVTGTKAAELTAYGDMKTIARMAILVNRYCLMMFLPLTVYLAIFGRQLLKVWLNPAFAAESAPLLSRCAIVEAVAVVARGVEIVIVESLANLDQLPPRFTFIGFPMNITGRDGSPIRAVALLD